LRERRWLAVGCAVLVAFTASVTALVLLLVRPSLLFRLLALGGVGMTLLSVVAMVRSAHKATTVSVKAQIVSIVVSVMSVVVFAGLLGSRVGALGWLATPFAGGMIGTLWCFTTRLRVEDGRVRRQGGLASLVVWAFVFVTQQLIAVVLGRAPTTGTLLLLFGTGIVVGQGATLIARTALVRSRVA
jgi:hypothetical protein